MKKLTALFNRLTKADPQVLGLRMMQEFQKDRPDSAKILRLLKRGASANAAPQDFGHNSALHRAINCAAWQGKKFLPVVYLLLEKLGGQED